MRPLAALLLLGLVALSGCSALSSPSYTIVAVYVDAPAAVAIASAHPGFYQEKAGRSPLEPPADASYGPLALSPDDVAVVAIRWTKGHWPMEGTGTWDESVSLLAEGSELLLLSQDRASRGPEAMEPDVRKFLATVADLTPAETDRIVEAHLATWSTRGWEAGDDHAPAHASSKVDLDVDVGRLLEEERLGRREGCCQHGELVAAARYGDWNDWFVDVQITNWEWSGGAPGEEGDSRSIVVSAAGRLYVGGTGPPDIDREGALAWARSILDEQGFGAVSLEGAHLDRRPQWHF